MLNPIYPVCRCENKSTLACVPYLCKRHISLCHFDRSEERAEWRNLVRVAERQDFSTPKFVETNFPVVMTPHKYGTSAKVLFRAPSLFPIDFIIHFSYNTLIIWCETICYK